MANYFKEEEVLPLVLEWQQTQSEYVWNKIQKQVDKIILAIIHKYKFYRFEKDSFEDIFQHCRVSVWKSLQKYKEQQGTVFNYVTAVAKNSAFFYTKNRQVYRTRHCRYLDEEADRLHDVDKVSYDPIDQDIISEGVWDNIRRAVKHRTDSRKTKFEDEVFTALDIWQKWSSTCGTQLHSSFYKHLLGETAWDQDIAKRAIYYIRSSVKEYFYSVSSVYVE